MVQCGQKQWNTYIALSPLNIITKMRFENKAYIAKCEGIVNKLISQLNPVKNEEIQICSGYMFDTVRRTLAKKGYNVHSTKIQNPLQTKNRKKHFRIMPLIWEFPSST